MLAAAFLWAIIRTSPPNLTVSTADNFKTTSSSRKIIKFYLHPVQWPKHLLLLGTLALLVALARPRLQIEHEMEEVKGVDIMLLLDLSGSMRYLYDNADEDFVGHPLPDRASELGLESRLEIAERELTRFVEMRPGGRLGLIGFARYPHLVSPLTFDHQFILNNLEQLKEVRLPDGTGIAAPILAGVSRLKQSDSPERVMILFSDGEDNVPFEATPRQAAQIAAQHDIIIHTVGIGGGDTYSLRNTLTGQKLQPSDETFDQPLLEYIAEKTGGRFFKAEDSEQMRRVIDEIDQLTAAELERAVRAESRDIFFPWLITGLLLLLAGAVLEHTYCASVP